MSIESMMPPTISSCCPLLLLPSIFPSIRVFSSVSVLCIRWPKYCSFSFRISPSNEYSGVISFRIYWIDFLSVQGTLKSLFQHHSSKASILWSLTLSYYFVKKYIVTVTVIIEITFCSREIYILILWHTFVLYFLIYFLYFYNFQLSNILIAFLCNSMIAPAYKTYCLCIYSSFSNHGLLLVSTAVIICSFFKIQMKYHMYM